MAAPRALVQVKVDERSYRRAMERLAKYEGRPFRERMIKAHEAGGRLLVAPMRRAMDASLTGHGKTPGLLRSKVSMRKGKVPPGYIVKVGTKSRAPHSGLVTKGHRIVTRGGRDTGRRSIPRDFTERTIAAYEGRVVDFIAKNVASEGGGTLLGRVRSF